MAEVLKQALGSLCNRTGWCYAVFWKLKRRSRMVLTWEDGYYEFATVQMSANAALLTGNGRNPLEGCTVEDQIQLAVAKMSFHVYSLGEGIIGRVAFTGKHEWIFASGERSLESGSNAPEKFPDGWSNQFAAGIKTIAVVAVQQGVVQLGSTQMMTEDLNMVGQIRALFGTLQSVPGAFVSEFVPDVRLPPSKTPASSLSCRISPSMTSLGRSSLNLRNLRAPEAGQSSSHPAKFAEAGLYSAQVSSSGWSSPNRMTFSSLEQRTPGAYDFQSSVMQQGGDVAGGFGRGFARSTNFFPEENFAKRGKSPFDGSIQIPSTVVVHHSKQSQNTLTGGEHSSFNNSADTGRASSAFDFPGSYGSKLTTDNSSRQQFDTNLWSQGSVFSIGDLEPFTEEAGGAMMQSDEGFDYSSLFKAFQKDDLDDFNNLLASLNKDCPGQSNSTSHFAVGDELSEVLIPHQKPGKEEAATPLVRPPAEDVKVQKQHLTPFELPSEIITTFDKAPVYGDIFVGFSDKQPEQLLDAVVAGAASTVSLSSSHFKESPENSLGGGEASRPVSSSVGNGSPNSKKHHHAAAAAAAASSFDRDAWPSSSVSLEASSSSWTDGSHVKRSAEERSFKDASAAAAARSKQEESGRISGRKRLRPGEAPRPRPKDRQQIQDRVRELRDIVPNATKCSIDALLEKTIRHMKFLQSVTQHGDKWKSGADIKGIDQSSLESGASWALEFDGKGTGVPILVENLKQPRQMLVEMLCEERGLFWEIAENIRSLGLTILKGVMESRNDKIWARFNVEAAKEVHRLKVVWNLSQLLKINTNCGGVATSSFGGSEVTDVCSEPLTTRFHPQVATWS